MDEKTPVHTKKMTLGRFQKNIAVIVTLITLAFLVGAILLSLQSARKMRELVSDQFNQEQLVIARNVAFLIQREIDQIKKNLLRLAQDIRSTPISPVSPETGAYRIRKSLLDMAESGVFRIDIVDMKTLKRQRFMPHKLGTAEDLSDLQRQRLKDIDCRQITDVWTSELIIQASTTTLLLGVCISDEDSRLLVYHLNVSWFLKPFLKDIHSGKSGYAWVIDHNGFFLYHPKTEFIRQNAFTARHQKDPAISFGIINTIQKEKMLKGLEGTDWYYSGWHRGITGKVKKLIAYAPAIISENPLRNWSVAVVAPVAEIEQALKKRDVWQLSLQGFAIMLILMGAGTIIFFMLRWSRILERTVGERTRELKKSEEKYRSLVESAEDFIFTLDAGGNLQSMNSFTASFFGAPPEYFLGKPLDTLFAADIAARQIKLVQHVRNYGKSIRDEFELDMGENRIWISANFMPIKNEDGATSAILCIARDITENKNLETQLINAEKLASLGTLAAGVAHEVNNPLGVILGFCDLLLRNTDRTSQAYEDLKTIERQGLHCKEVVENLLSFARLGNGSYEHTDLNHCLREIIKVVRHILEMNDIELVTQFGSNIPPVRGDFRELQQVFLNLINNAIAAMENGGLLRIRTYQDRGSRKSIVQIQDNGSGIRKEDMEHIFEPFFTTKPEGEGTGLGLFVSYGIITKYGGTIDCLSSLTNALGKSKGTTFTLRLLNKQGEIS